MPIKRIMCSMKKGRERKNIKILVPEVALVFAR